MKRPIIPHCKTLFNLVRTKEDERQIEAACLDAQRWFARKYLGISDHDQALIETAESTKPVRWRSVEVLASTADTRVGFIELVRIAGLLKTKYYARRR